MTGNKPCDRCRQIVPIRYRIQYDLSGEWFLVCRQCWQKLSEDNPYYRYGGTWKAKKK
ncbi:MAG TPA: hypothetical protein ACFCUY_06700 [Xenococcaceae cyanobacterium]